MDLTQEMCSKSSSEARNRAKSTPGNRAHLSLR